ncbi:MAG: outer membrane protein transport protein [Xanthomonadales bacterium]|nr:outer membrane protein transport protein [Xanthomonadales bacterium]
MKLGKKYTGLLAVLLLAYGGTAMAQRGEPQAFDGNVSVPVELLPPGARALGLSGAFTAVADDATAAEANPAGLTILRAPELSVHFRDSDYDLVYYDAEARNSGAFGGQTGELLKNYRDSSNNLAFASVVYPWEKFVFSAFYTNNLDLDASSPTETIFDPNFVDTFTSENSLRGELEGYGLSTAFRFNEFISLGITVKETKMSVNSLDRQTIDNFQDFEFLFEEITGVAPAADFARVITDRFIISNELAGDDHDVTFNYGILFNPASTWSVGLVYKEGGTYKIPAVNTFAQQLGCMGTPGDLLFDICQAGFDGVDLGQFNFTNRDDTINEIGVPDTFTLGIAWRPTDTWLLSLDINNIDYSDLPAPRDRTLGFEFLVDGSSQAIANDIEPISDAVTYHFGVEKIFFPEMELFDILTLRAGAFTDDDHDGTRLVDSDDTHFTVGIGTVINGNLQIDLAAESSDRIDNIVLSAIYRF